MTQPFISPSVFVGQLFEYHHSLIPEESKESIYLAIQEKIESMQSSNRTDFYDVVNVYEKIKDQLDEKTTVVFLRFFKSSIDTPSFKEYLEERHFDLEAIEKVELISKRRSSKRNNSVIKKSSSDDFLL
jgi:hypothetical protein